VWLKSIQYLLQDGKTQKHHKSYETRRGFWGSFVFLFSREHCRTGIPRSRQGRSRPAIHRGENRFSFQPIFFFCFFRIQIEFPLGRTGRKTSHGVIKPLHEFLLVSQTQPFGKSHYPKPSLRYNCPSSVALFFAPTHREPNSAGQPHRRRPLKPKLPTFAKQRFENPGAPGIPSMTPWERGNQKNHHRLRKTPSCVAGADVSSSLTGTNRDIALCSVLGPGDTGPAGPHVLETHVRVHSNRTCDRNDENWPAGAASFQQARLIRSFFCVVSSTTSLGVRNSSNTTRSPPSRGAASRGGFSRCSMTSSE